MTLDELEILISPNTQALLAELSDADPEAIALGNDQNGVPARLLATQIKYTQRAQKKLPEWAEARCIFTKITLEQASSQATASMKYTLSGARAADLTMGQGVDSWQLASKFDQVVSVERDEVRCQMARHNFKALGTNNIEVVHEDAKSWLAAQPEKAFDLLYLDPARRDHIGKRTVSFADCQPNLLELLPDLRRVGRAVWVKASPMIDIDLACAQIGEPVQVCVLAVDGECKEVIFKWGDGHPHARAVMFERNGEIHAFEATGNEPEAPIAVPDAQYTWLLEPDVSLYKAAIARVWFGQWQGHCIMNHPMGYGFATEVPAGYAGRAFKIVQAMEYKPKAIRKAIARTGKGGMHVTTRNFDVSVADLRKKLSIKEGDGGYINFTRLPDGKRMVYFTERIL